MNSIHLTYPEFARVEMTLRLREADQQRRRRLVRHQAGLARRSRTAKR